MQCCSCYYFSEDRNWSKTLRNFPKISILTCSDWLAQGGKKNAGEKSYKFFREGYVYDIYTCEESGDFYVKARCYRSLRKSEDPHYLSLILKEDNDKAAVSRAHCSCKGGSGGHCNHVLALLYQLNDYSCLDIKDIPSDVTCTSRPQSWHIPRASSICPLPVMATHYARAETDRVGERKRDPVKCKLYDARSPAIRKGLPMCHVMEQVDNLKRKEIPPPFSYLLSDQEPSLLMNTVFGNVPLGACLAYQLQDHGRPNTRFVSNRIRGSFVTAVQCSEFIDLPVGIDDKTSFDLTELNMLNQPDLTSFFTDHTVIDKSESYSLEQRTVLQGESAEWVEQHQFRLTASNFGKVYSRIQRPSESMLKSIFCPKDLSNVRAISHGKGKEKVARTIYARKMQQQVPGFAIFDAGITVHPKFPYLGATPDGKVFDPSSSSKFGLLEIKCPYSKRGDTLDQASSDPDFYIEKVGADFFLKKTHFYYAQVQGQLALTGLPWCDFCVYLSDSNEMCVDRIHFDSDYWENELLPKLKNFFFNYALSFIVGKAKRAQSCSRTNEELVLVGSHT